MTTTPQSPNDLMLSPDPTAKVRRRRSEFWQVCWLVSLSSLMISMYAIFLSQHLAPAASQHDLDQAALMLAKELSTITVNHSRFGNVGLVDIKQAEHSQIGLNRLQATLRLDGILARQLGFDYMSVLVGKDVRELNQLTRELSRLERELASPQAERDILQREPFLDLVKNVLARTGAGGRLKSLSISLGGLKPGAELGSNTPLPPIEEERNSFFADKGNYLAHVPVPIWQNFTYSFYELANSVRLVPAQYFLPLKSDEVASVVKIEAYFEVAERGRQKQIQKMESCAMVGATPLPRPSLVFMLSFPQGYLSKFSCINDLFNPQNYTSVQGDWLEATGGDVPEDGHFEKTRVLDKMPPALSAMHCLYHFLRQAGPEVNPANLKALLYKPISTVEVNNPTGSASPPGFNSGLFKDTGAARFALLKQSFRDGAGQKAIKNAFSGKQFQDLIPQYTFPVAIDSNGTVTLPGETFFDKTLVRDFLDALYQTNIAGIESLQISQTIVSRMQNSIEQSEKQIASLNEELHGIKHSIDLAPSIPNKEEADKLTQLKKQQKSLSTLIQAEQNRKAQFEKTKAKAVVTAQNAREAARSCYEIGAHMYSFVSPGIRRITAPFKGFLLGGKSVAFIPHTIPVDEDDIYEPFQADSGSDAQLSQSMHSWMSHQFNVTEIPDPGMFVDGKPIIDYWQKSPIHSLNPPLYIMLSVNELLAQKDAHLYASRSTPFDFERGVVGKAQVSYYAPQCIESGSSQKVSWSVMVRDLVYTLAQGAGKALFSNRPHWCLDIGMNEESCPGLAVEFQIRTPLPKLEGALSGTYLQDPAGGPSIPLYPPLPPDLI